MKNSSRIFTALAAAGFGITAADGDLVNGDFSTAISDPSDAHLDSGDLNNGWQSFNLVFGNDTPGVATTRNGQAEGHVMAQLFDNTQTGLVALSFDWAPAATEELNYAVYGYNGANTGDVVYINATFSNNGPVDLAGGDTLVTTFPPLTGNGVTGDTTSATFDITGYDEIAVAFWQPTAATGGVLDNVAITPIPEVSAIPEVTSAAPLLGILCLGLGLRRRC